MFFDMMASNVNKAESPQGHCDDCVTQVPSGQTIAVHGPVVGATVVVGTPVVVGPAVVVVVVVVGAPVVVGPAVVVGSAVVV